MQVAQGKRLDADGRRPKAAAQAQARAALVGQPGRVDRPGALNGFGQALLQGRIQEPTGHENRQRKGSVRRVGGLGKRAVVAIGAVFGRLDPVRSCGTGSPGLGQKGRQTGVAADHMIKAPVPGAAFEAPISAGKAQAGLRSKGEIRPIQMQGLLHKTSPLVAMVDG